MTNLNPLFKKIQNVQMIQNEKMPRKQRKDKVHNIKFPADHVLHMKLRTYFHLAAPQYELKYRKPLAQTKFNTLLLRYILNNQHLVDWDVDYKDTKRYMHTNLLETEFQEIGGAYGVSIRKGFSVRKTVFIFMKTGVKWLERGGNIGKIL